MKPYRAISTDDHLMEAADGYTSRMSAQWGDKIPQVRDAGDGADAWYVFGRRITSLTGFSFVQGVTPDRGVVTRWADVPKSAYVASERVKAMDADGIDAHSFYPNVGNVQTLNHPKEPEALRLEALRACNAIQIEDYVRPYPGRFIAIAVVPLWDPAQAVAEFHWAAERGMKGVSFAFPQQFGYPDICDPAWDVLWAALQEAGLPLHLHIGSGGSMGMGAQVWKGHTDPMLRLSETSVKAISANTSVAATLLFSGILERFPRLTVMFAESGVGWIPYLLDIADHQWERQRMSRHGMPTPPSELFRRQCYANFWFEHIGDEVRRSPGLANVTWLSDFPHPTSTFPTSWQYIDRALADCTPEERQMILVETPRRLYHLPEGY
ncbi:MAG: amidohydrolase family protein [Candidatus Binatia bacterium]